MSGEKYRARRRSHYLWEVVGEGVSVVYSGITEAEARKAAASMNAARSTLVSPEQATALLALVHRLREYAKHAPLCNYSPTYPDQPEATCDCGFDAVLNDYDRWAAL